MVARLLSLLLVLALAGPAWGQITTQTHSTIPSANSSFLTDTQNFLANEDAQRYRDMFADFVVAGGVITPGAGLTKTPSALTAYANGYYLTESGSITFVDNSTTYVIANSVTTGNLTGFTRVAGTHYLTATGGAEPTLPAGAVRISTVTTAGGSVTLVTDERNFFFLPLTAGGLALNLSFPPSGTLLIGNGNTFSQNTLTQGVGAQITNGAGTITIAAPGTNSWIVHGNKSLVATTTTMTLAADAVVLRASDNTQSIQHGPANLTNTVTTAGPAANGRDQVGTFTASSFIHFYWIWNGATLASLSSAVAPPTGPTLPTGYTMWAYCCTVRFDGASHLVSTRCFGGWCYLETSASALSAGAATVETGVDLSAIVPANATQVLLNAQARVHDNGIAAVDTIAKVRYITAKDYSNSRIQTDTSGQWNSTTWTLTVPQVAQNVFYLWTNNTNATTNALDLDVLGYKVSE